MHSARIILVAPLAEGWSVRCAGLETLVFRSGARAEAQARRLAACMAGLGRTAQVRIHDRSRKLVGQQVYPPVQPA